MSVAAVAIVVISIAAAFAVILFAAVSFVVVFASVAASTGFAVGVVSSALMRCHVAVLIVAFPAVSVVSAVVIGAAVSGSDCLLELSHRQAASAVTMSFLRAGAGSVDSVGIDVAE